MQKRYLALLALPLALAPLTARAGRGAAGGHTVHRSSASGSASSAPATPPPGPTPIPAAPIPPPLGQISPADAKLVARFGPPRTGPNLTNNPTRSTNPQIASSGNDVYLVWEDTAAGAGDVYFSFSHDGGASFFAPRNLSSSPGKSSYPVIAVSGRNVVIAWLESQGNYVTVMGTSSSDAENALTPPAMLSVPEVRARELSVGAADGWLAAVWVETSIEDGVAHGESVKYRALSPATKPVVLASAPDTGRFRRPQVARSSSITFATWGADRDVSLAFGNNQSFTVNTSTKFGRDGAAVEWNPRVVGVGTNAAFAYETRSATSHAFEIHATGGGYAGLFVPASETPTQMGGAISYAASQSGLTYDMSADLAVSPDGHVHGAAIVRNVDNSTMLVVDDIDTAHRTAQNTSLFANSSIERVRVAANASATFTAIEGSIGGQPKDLHLLRARGNAHALWTLGPSAGSMSPRSNVVVAATNRGAVVAWQAGPLNAEDIFFATLSND